MAEIRYIEGQNRYALEEVVGRGGFGTVWRAQARRGEEVAIKIIPVYHEGERSRAMREGQIAEGLKHRNIVETIEIIAGPHEVYLVTEYVEGLPLDEAAEIYDVEEIVGALAQILEALVYAHGQGVIHRDIKPQNALVDERGVVKITDFGVAYRPGDTRLTQIGFAVGTPGYIAPELIDGDADPSALSDIYAVGATARTLLANYPYEVPPRLTEFINQATSPNPAHRPQGAWAALKLLTGRKEPTVGSSVSVRDRIPSEYSEQILRMANGLIAGWLAYLGAGLLLGGAGAAGVAAGFGVLGYLLPRIAALGVIVALAVALLRNGVGLGFAALVPALGGVWVAASSYNTGASRFPLGPVLAVPLAAVGLGAGLPLLFGALMRPLGAIFSAALGALALVFYDLTLGDGVTRYLGLQIGVLPGSMGLQTLAETGQSLLTGYPQFLFQAALWAAMAGIVSAAEWFGRPFVGLFLAAGVGALGYASIVSYSPDALAGAMTSLGLAAIMYGALRYLGYLVRG